jgi:hypothetical protein
MSDLIKIADWSGKPRANVVFVHGLGGDAYGSWRRGPDNDSFWPLWLAQDIEGICVYTLGYAAPPSNWLGTAMPLQDRVGNVRARLLATPALLDAPIIFICHSLGGLIVKQLLLDLHQQKDRDSKAAAMLNNVKQVVFMATPHAGSAHGTLLDRLRFLAWPTPIAGVLVANDPTLRSINVSYRGLADERRDVLSHLVFYETQGTAAGVIVDAGSADPGLPGEPPIAIDADHIAIVKPADRSALQYVSTRNFVSKSPKADEAPASLRSYPLPPVQFVQPKNIVPRLARVAMLIFIAFVAVKGVAALGAKSPAGAVSADCGSVANSGSLFGSSISVGGAGSTANCPPKSK